MFNSWLTAMSAVPAHVVTAWILGVGGLVALLFGLIRSREAFLRYLPTVVFVLAGAALFWPLTPMQSGIIGNTIILQKGLSSWPELTVLGLALVAWVVHLVMTGRPPVAPQGETAGATGSWYYLGVGVLLCAGFLASYIARYVGFLLAWEGTVMANYSEAFLNGQDWATFASNWYLWDDGTLSAGQTSLLYGPPTYWLFLTFGFSVWTLRIMAVVALVLSVVVIYLIGRRFFNPVIAGAAAVFLAINACALNYGRYGSSPAGTLLAVLLAVYFTWWFLADDRRAWWSSLPCAAALFLATLGYSPGRLVVLVLLAFALVVPLLQWRRLWWRRLVGLVLLCAAVWGVYQLERQEGAEDKFCRARGEQFLATLDNPDSIAEVLGRTVLPEELTAGDKVEILYRMLKTTVPQYLTLIAPTAFLSPLAAMDLPPLYYGPLGIFILWGLAHSLRRWKQWPHACLLLWVIAITGPLLLTNRVDSHRIMLFVIPFGLWAALGVWEVVLVLRAAQVPKYIQQGLAGLLMLSVLYSDVEAYFQEVPPFSSGIRALMNALPAVPGKVVVGSLGVDGSERAWLQLRLLERTRRNRSQTASLLDNDTLNVIAASPGGRGNRQVLNELTRLAKDSTLLLMPADQFGGLASALHQRGFSVVKQGAPIKLWRVDSSPPEVVSATPAQPGAPPVPTPTEQPTPTPFPNASGANLSLTELQPRDISFTFAAPQINHTWNGGAIIMSDIGYPQGIGMHASSRMTFDVPKGAWLFQSMVGLPDNIRNCTAASVTFEVRDGRDQLLYQSGIVGVSTEPIPVTVEVRSATAVTLAVTDAGDGQTCDHANWGNPVFVLEPGAEAPGSGVEPAEETEFKQ